MVKLQGSNADGGETLLLMPNRSVDWATNKKVIIALGSFSLFTALIATFTLGAWPVLPFAGIEVMAIAAALYYVSWKLNYRQIIKVFEKKIIIEKGVYYPKQAWQWPRSDITLLIQHANHPLTGKKLALACDNQRIEIGEFLNAEERQITIDHLVRLRLAVRYDN